MENKEKGLSAWQLTMMALGCVIGGSFFLGSSVALNAAGAGVIIAYVLGGVIVYYILYALSEMTISNPATGSFRTFAARAFGQGAGFVVGWVYWTGMVLAMSSEATAVSILVRQWLPNMSIPLLGGIIIVSVTLVNLLGADKLSRLESGLAAVKIFAIAAFIIIAILLILGLYPGKAAVGMGKLSTESLLPGGIAGIAGSMLIVLFAYAGFEIIGLAASEAREPKKTVPKAIRYTVLSLIALYIISNAVILPLISTSNVSETQSPMVAALSSMGIGWAATAVNIVLITAILSTMLASMFGLGRMIRSLVDEGLAPAFLKDKKDVPRRGILFSGLGMLLGLGFALLFPKVYLFLISSGGFAVIFTYAAIMATHIRFRKLDGSPADGEFKLRGFPYSSLLVLVCLIGAMVSMPFVAGQSAGLIAGIIIVAFYTVSYLFVKWYRTSHKNATVNKEFNNVNYQLKSAFQSETSKELNDIDSTENDDDMKIYKNANDNKSSNNNDNIENKNDDIMY